MSTDHNYTSSPHGLFVGLTTVDIIFSFDQFPEEDTKNTANSYLAVAGGPATNAAVAFCHLAGNAQLVSSLGKSGVADIAKEDLTSFRLKHTDLTPERAESPALSAIAIAADSGSRTILTSPAIDDDVENPLDDETISSLVKTADIILLDGHQAHVAEAVARQAQEAGKQIVLDGDIYNPALERIIPMIDVAICSKGFALPRSRSPEEVFRYFALHGVTKVAITNGAQPIEFWLQDDRGRLEIEPVQAIDTLGAGDFFHGAFCYGLASGLAFHDALRLARDIAQRSVTSFGTREWMKHHDVRS